MFIYLFFVSLTPCLNCLDYDCSKLDAGGQDTSLHEVMGTAVILDNLYNLENLH